MRKRMYTLIISSITAVGAVSIFLGIGSLKDSGQEAVHKRYLRILRNDSTSSLTELDELLELAPDHIEALILRALRTSDPREALDFVRRVKSGHPEKLSKARYLEGVYLLELRDARRAEQAFRASLDAFPGNSDAQNRLVSLLALLRCPEEVREVLSSIRKYRPLSLPELSLWIICENRVTSYEDASSFLQGFLDAHPDDVKSLRAQCIYLEEESRTNEAIHKLTAAADDGSPELQFLLAGLLLRNERRLEAIKILNRLDASDARRSNEWETLATAATESGDIRLSLATTEYAAKNFGFHRQLAYLHYRNLSKSEDSVQQTHWESRVEVLNSLFAEVETVGVTIIRNRPDPKTLARVAELLLKLGQAQEAIFWTQAAVDIAGPNEITERLKHECHEQLTSATLNVPTPPLEAWQIHGPLQLPAEEPAFVKTNDKGSNRVRLEDHASRIGLNVRYENGNTGFKYLIETMGGAAGVIDFDSDGWPDLYFPQGGTLGDGPEISPLSDQLFRNLRGSRAVDVTKAAEIHEIGYSEGLAVGDVDNDGFDDVFVANVGQNSLWINCGDGTFVSGTRLAGLDDLADMSSSSAFADLDGDSDLDLYVVNYVDGLKICRNDLQQISTCNPSSHSGARDSVYENLGDGRFRNRTKDLAVDEGRGKGLGVMITNLDEDRRPDVFVSNDTTPNLLYTNQCSDSGWQFEETGLLRGVAVSGNGTTLAGMGIACGDLNRDLQNDLYVTNFHREPNTLYLQTGVGMFLDQTSRSGLREPTLPLLGFGTQAVDLDHDGWLELFVANGHIDDQTSKGVPWKMPAQLFRTSDGHQWEEISGAAGNFMQAKALGRGVAVVDFDRDQRPDLAISYQDRNASLVFNQSTVVGQAFSLNLVATRANRSAINTVVRWTVSGTERISEIRGGDGYLCSNDRRIILPCPNSAVAETVIIEWPDGAVETFDNVACGHDYIVRQGLGRLLSESH